MITILDFKGVRNHGVRLSVWSVRQFIKLCKHHPQEVNAKGFYLHLYLKALRTLSLSAINLQYSSRSHNKTSFNSKLLH